MSYSSKIFTLTLWYDSATRKPVDWKGAAASVGELLDELTPEQRLDFIREAQKEFCEHCGYSDCSGQCCNDE